MKADLHIAETKDVLNKGDFVETLCDKKFPARTIQPLAETDWIPGSRAESTEPKGICKKCLEVRMFRYLVSDRESKPNEEV